MSDLNQEIADSLRAVLRAEFPSQKPLEDLLNNVIDERTDFEHIITFLDESPSKLHRDFAGAMRRTFEAVLRKRFQTIEAELGKTPDRLYVALLDMHDVRGLQEVLRGFLTINYDNYLESAVTGAPNLSLDTGIDVRPVPSLKRAVKVLKLHGSFDWNDAWPITHKSASTLWIPPGIQKTKDRYPFNALWGLARELLDCDVLRIIGCRLGGNDWDLISLLFTTCHTNAERGPYRVEIIDSPKNAQRLKRDHPYLGVQSILEIEPIGSQLIGEFMASAPKSYSDLTSEEKRDVIAKAGTDKNWFHIWLKQRAEALNTEFGSVSTAVGAFEQLLTDY